MDWAPNPGSRPWSRLVDLKNWASGTYAPVVGRTEIREKTVETSSLLKVRYWLYGCVPTPLTDDQ